MNNLGKIVHVGTLNNDGVYAERYLELTEEKITMETRDRDVAGYTVSYVNPNANEFTGFLSGAYIGDTIEGKRFSAEVLGVYTEKELINRERKQEEKILKKVFNNG